ncbi:uncharacterized protein LOC111314264 isoform X5 [Durio zibethinus]|uniref:Uncharacterized protein LOC111314264 isoform X5 n=1 Tax=Durio zibethinus TaxID=66656 RepID=A0A6P6B1Y7_DURZI|nr:uncharacterized protein LOC111314264 isoform X5 [Durio zibethinus]
MEDSLRIQRFDQLPSATQFASQIESRNVPAVFVGCVKDWKAVSKWNPCNGGLDYLEERVGSFMVEAMLSRTAPVFYGDLRSHERVPLPFSTFIGFCKQHRQNVDNSCSFNSNSEGHKPGESDTEQGCSPFVDAAPQQIYLAQVPIINAENEERVQLETLREDMQLPAILEEKNLSSINLWMNNAKARSSAHYDPHHNLLCIVTGRKQVVLWPPSASPMLYPMPIYGEASNHSSVALENPDFSVHPRAQYSMEYSQKVILHAGDALFIPEGWFHQVDSYDLTIAVNYWWCSSIMSSLADHMDAYYLRRILRRTKYFSRVLLLCGDRRGIYQSCLVTKHNFPRTLEALILHLLSPVGAEVLTRKFDDIDKQNSEEHRNKFYQVFYGVFDNQFAAMDAILNGKESFARQAFKNVLDKYLGGNFNVPKLCVGRDIL